MTVIVLGLIASLLVVSMSLTIKRSNVMKISLLLGTVTTTMYALLGEWTTVVLALIALTYNVLLMFDEKFPVLRSKNVTYVLIGLYSLAFFGLNGFSLSLTLLSYSASILGSVMLLIRSPLALKYAMLANGLLWAAFQFGVGAYGNLIGEAFYLVGIVFSVVLLMRAKKRGENMDSIPELPQVIMARFRNSRLRKTDSTRVADKNLGQKVLV